MSKEGDDHREFSYSGQLVFNSLISTKILSGDAREMREKLIDNLEPFSRGEPGSASKGFTDMFLEEQAKSSPEVDEQLQDVAEELIGEKFIKEHYFGNDDEELVNEEGKETTAWVRQTDETYVYWNYPDYMFIQGAQTKVTDTRDAIQAALKDSAEPDEEPLDPNFLLWILYRFQKYDGDVPGAVTIDRLTTSETYGELENFGRRNRVQDSSNVALSVPLITAILYQMKLRLLQGEFKVKGYDVTSKINTSGRIGEGSGRIHVMSGGDIEKSENDLEKVLIANLFVSEIISLYQSWRDMDPKDKYPPLTYFDDMAGTALDRDVDLSKVDVSGLIEEYSGYREVDPDLTEFDYLVDNEEEAAERENESGEGP